MDASMSFLNTTNSTLILALLVALSTNSAGAQTESRASQPQPPGVAARGRIEPKDGLFAISGPSGPIAVVASLLVELGDEVSKDEVIAVLDDVGLRAADVQRAKAQRANVANELRRNVELQKRKMISAAEMESLELRVAIADAELAQANAAMDRTRVKSPIDGRVIAIHTREGERVGINGIVELGKTQEMYVIAEVYETDIGRIRMGQKARAFSPALKQPLTGQVERIGLKVGKMEALATDPVSRVDARVVEVQIKLDDSSLAADLTNLQVEVILEA
jgi:multidrug resistance efflux pump